MANPATASTTPHGEASDRTLATPTFHRFRFGDGDSGDRGYTIPTSTSSPTLFPHHDGTDPSASLASFATVTAIPASLSSTTVTHGTTLTLDSTPVSKAVPPHPTHRTTRLYSPLNPSRTTTASTSELEVSGTSSMVPGSTASMLVGVVTTS